jgi:hypothetical protein
MLVTLSQLLPQLFVGSCPANIDDIDRLKTDYGITAILSLQTDDELDYSELGRSRIEGRCDESGIGVQRIPVEAFDGEDGLRNLSRCVTALDERLRRGHSVYIHCNLGTVRSPSVVIAYLVWRQGWKLTDAVEHVRSCHACSPDIAAILLADSDCVAV